MTNNEFLELLGNFAKVDMANTKILASLTIAQGILESGWGKSDLAVTGKNLFGIKANSSWTGKVYSSITKECYDGTNLVNVTASFKAYDDWGESIADHSALLTGASRYAKVVGETNYKVACQAVKDAGYATDPDYPNKLITLIEQYKLYEYDLVETNSSTVNVNGGNTTMSSNSGLISQTILSPNKSTRQNTISKIAIHCMAGNMTAVSCGNFFAKSTTRASSHYGIGSDGDVCLYVNESDRAWCTGGTKTLNGVTGSQIDHMAVTIEVANPIAAEPWAVSDTAFAKLLDLVEDITRRNNLYPITFTGDNNGTLQAHRWYAAKACPGSYLYDRFQSICDTVNARIQNSNTVATPETLPQVNLEKFPTTSTEECSDWATEIIEEVVALGISDGTNPKDNVTREQCMAMALKAYKLAVEACNNK